MDENMIQLAGTLVSPPTLSHESHGQQFYQITLATKRLSGTPDILKVQFPITLLEETKLTAGGPVGVKGHIRSYNNKSGVGSRLVLSVLAKTLTNTPGADLNLLALTGTLCKTPIYRKTPLGREICDLLLAVSRYHGRSDYLPCIVWGTTARATSELKIGDRISLKGRLQSRQYAKHEGTVEVLKTAFEISASELKYLEEVL